MVIRGSTGNTGNTGNTDTSNTPASGMGMNSSGNNSATAYVKMIQNGQIFIIQ